MALTPDPTRPTVSADPPSALLRELARRVLVLDGAMGTSIHQYPLDVERDYCGCENCTDILVKSRPDVIRAIHESFLAAGADAVETDTFGANPLVLAEFGIAAQARELNRLAVDVARAACRAFAGDGRPRFVVGSIGPGTRLVTLGNTTWDEMFESYREQARGLLDGEPGNGGRGGPDAFIIETCQDLLQVKCAINAVLAALDERGRTPAEHPIMVSVTIETTGTMLLGTQIEAAAAALRGYPIVSLGLNCATGPTEMAEHVHWLGRHWGGTAPGGVERAVSVIPNAGLPVLADGRTEYPLKPEPFAAAMRRFIEQDGVRIVGGCCGTTPEHIRLLAEAVSRGATGLRPVSPAGPAPAPPSAPAPPIRSTPKPGCTSLYSVTEYRQDNSFLIVGERMNASGSKKFRSLLEAEDWDGIVSLAREQVRHDGAHVLDLNVDYAGRDNPRDMAEIVRRVVRQVDAPLMIDSTQVRTIEAGLKHAGGKCLINSANFEDGEEKFDRLCALAKTYGAGLVVGSIDEDKQASMARTADRKLAIALRAFERATRRHGLDPADLLFDPLVLPISTGMESDRRSGLETIEGVRRIARALPESQTLVGLSNVSFGLSPAARVVLNSVFLHELRDAGLTAAIVHASKILPRNKIPDDQWAAAQDLIYDRRRDDFDPLQAFISLFKDAAATTAVKAERRALTLEDRLRAHIVDGEKEGLEATIAEALSRYPPLDIINNHLLDGMKVVGDLFGSGQMQLPFVLQSAEVMKRAVALLEPHMEKVQGATRGSIVLATVKGDVHDIGKNLVDIILSNNGYTVHNLGIKQPIASIIAKWRETGADAIGLSGLLVKSVNVMEENLRELNDEGITVPVILGGAALTRHYCESHLRATYRGQCLYGKDAFDGLRVMDHIVSGRLDALAAEIDQRQGKRSRAEELINRTRRERAVAASAAAGGAGAESAAIGPRARACGRTPGEEETSSAAATLAAPASRARSGVPVLPAEQVPRPPFWGSRVISGLDLDDIYPFINTTALFRGQWQVRKGALSDAEYDALIEDTIVPVFERLKARCRDEGILQPAVVYGYWPCNSDGDDLVIYAPPDEDRTPDGDRLGGSAPDGFPAAPLREIERFTFPRQADRQRLCIADFFEPVSSGVVDVVGMHCVTMGPRVTQAARALFEANSYTEYLYLHGLGVETAEALAEMWHKRIRQELGIAGDDSPRIRELFTQHYRGSRYSFGYPACPSMADQEKLWRLLRPERIGCTLTENWQIDPEQSTSAIIVHHPAAKYFNV
jgi:5-methyltetrahydrofolate--homocysteine methyltransferase